MPIFRSAGLLHLHILFSSRGHLATHKSQRSPPFSSSENKTNCCNDLKTPSAQPKQRKQKLKPFRQRSCIRGNEARPNKTKYLKPNLKNTCFTIHVGEKEKSNRQNRRKVKPGKTTATLRQKHLRTWIS